MTWRLNVGWLDDLHPHATGPVPDETLEATYVDARGETGYVANGEIRVPDADGSLYAAPKLIGHYVEAHQYLPPEGFLRAIDDYVRTSGDNLALGWIYWEKTS